MKLISFNVNGIRASVNKGFIDTFQKLDADIFCVQETKAQDDQVIKALEDLNEYYIYSNSAEKKGYSGVAIISKQEANGVIRGIGKKGFDDEGRVLTADFNGFYFVVVYVPNSGSGMKRLEYRAKWDKAFASFLRKLRKQKPVIVGGDLNVAHTEIDLKNPKPNYNKTSGFTQTEIDGLNTILKAGFKDSFRSLHPELIKYTFWNLRFNARKTNAGWRIDYFLVDKDLMPKVKEANILNDIMGSDHCPIELIIDL